MANPRPYLSCLRIAITATALVWGWTGAAGAPPPASVAPAPPKPIEQQVSVKRGESVDIPLRIYGTRAQTLGWLIRQRPAHGKLSNLRSTAPESGIVTYTPPADLRVVSDRFTFSVRSNEGVSAAAEVQIAIVDDAPLLIVPTEMNFGTLLVGEASNRTLQLSNGGGGVAEGEWIVDPPWRAVGERRYKLAAGERQVAKILFSPDKPGEFKSEVRFTSQLDRVTTITGTALAPLAVKPATLLLKDRRGTARRSAEFELRNHTDEPFEVALIASQRLKFPPTVEIEAHGKSTVTLETAENDVAPLDETMRFAAGNLEASLAVKANAPPAILSVRPESVTFRSLVPGATAKESIVLKNDGGGAAQVVLSVGAPFSVAEKSFPIEAGASREVTISIAASSPGRVQSVLQITGGESVLEIPVEATISTGISSAASTRPPSTTPVKAPREEPESPRDLQPAVAFPAKVVASGKDEATFEWQGEIPSGATLRCQRRILSVAGNGGLAARYEDFPDCTFERRDGVNVATVRKLPPGETHHLRIDAVGPKGIVPVTFAQVSTPPQIRWRPKISLLQALCALAFLAAGVALWQRHKRSRSGF
ncbi:MAG TPA: hypothetical protein VFD27_04250 [Chthoniobacteraceae bacterium]|nr:hypothetical protein [Chthoniobacteraceae bacterium]